MATFKSSGDIGEFGPKLISGMLERGISKDFAQRLVEQIRGFSNYGFPESHAASFAKIAYASSWMKCHHPDIFCVALLNAQPMGFYAPAQLIRDARAHGVEVRPVCINDSDWDTRMVPESHSRPRHRAFCGTDGDWASLMPIRLGMRIVQELSGEDVTEILRARQQAPFASVEDVWLRSKVKPAALERLARADAFHALGLNRRHALWAIKGLGERPLELFAVTDSRTGLAKPEGIETPVMLAPLTEGCEVIEDYRATHLSLRAHPISFLRDQLTMWGMIKCGDLPDLKDGTLVAVTGLILVRQRPGSAKGVVFVTLEDESGVANVILWPNRFEASRRVVMSATMLSIRGRVQKEGIVIHIVADEVADLTPLLRQVGELDFPRMTAPGDGATHGGTIDPRDRIKLPRQRALESWPARNALNANEIIPVKSRNFH